MGFVPSVTLPWIGRIEPKLCRRAPLRESTLWKSRPSDSERSVAGFTTVSKTLSTALACLPSGTIQATTMSASAIQTVTWSEFRLTKSG